jgi:hypothetical protein
MNMTVRQFVPPPPSLEIASVRYTWMLICCLLLSLFSDYNVRWFVQVTTFLIICNCNIYAEDQLLQFITTLISICFCSLLFHWTLALSLPYHCTTWTLSTTCQFEGIILFKLIQLYPISFYANSVTHCTEANCISACTEWVAESSLYVANAVLIH